MQSPPYTDEDHALLIGLDLYERGLCECGHPKSVAWHGDMDGWFDADESKFVCHACSAVKGEEVAYAAAPKNLRDLELQPLTPFQLGVTTTAPAPPPRHT